MADHLPEPLARQILQRAIDEGRASNLLACLFAGGAATVDPAGHLVLIDADVLAQMGAEVEP